jgi:hypothetical protein
MEAKDNGDIPASEAEQPVGDPTTRARSIEFATVPAPRPPRRRAGAPLQVTVGAAVDRPAGPAPCDEVSAEVRADPFQLTSELGI